MDPKNETIQNTTDSLASETNKDDRKDKKDENKNKDWRKKRVAESAQWAAYGGEGHRVRSVICNHYNLNEQLGNLNLKKFLTEADS